MINLDEVKKSLYEDNTLDFVALRKAIKDYPDYTDDILKLAIPEKTIYEYMFDCNKNNKCDTAQTFRMVMEQPTKKGKVKEIHTRNREVSYDEMFDKIGDFSKIYPALGLKPEDRVGMLLPNLPESTYFIYGANKYGVVSDNIDPTSKPNKLELFFKKENCKTIICFDLLYESTIRPIEHYLKEELGINDVIILSMTDSLIFPDKQVLELTSKIAQMKGKQKPLTSDVLNLIPLKQALKDSRYMNVVTNGFKPNDIAALCHSSGTTGLPKAIPTTNENMNFMDIQHKITEFNHEEMKTALHVLPAFAQFGLTDSMHLWHCHGMNLIEIPVFAFEKFVELLLEYKPNCVFGVPSWWIRLISDEKYNKIDLSFLHEAVAGGDKMVPNQIEAVNEFLQKHGAKCLLRVGYGMSEFGGTCLLSDTTNTPLDSCGSALIGGHAKIMNMETGLECGIKEPGMLCFNKITMPPKELDGKPLYNRTEIDGKDFIVTGDIMSKDENENYYFLSRESGMISRHDGYKVVPSKLENCIMKSPFVKSCMVSSYFDEAKYGNMPFIHIVLDKDYYESDLEIIIRDIVDNYILTDTDLCFKDIPTRWAIKKELLTVGIKNDYATMKSNGLDGTEIKIITDETNVEFYGYKLEFPKVLDARKLVLEKE